ncbi:flocculation protein flo11-like, partial [Trifolium pratense]
MSGAGSRDSISTGVKKTIQNIKEITGNHSDDEIYAMLKECSMDPNETAQKLLFQGFVWFFESVSVELGFWGLKWGPFGMKFCLA